MIKVRRPTKAPAFAGKIDCYDCVLRVGKNGCSFGDHRLGLSRKAKAEKKNRKEGKAARKAKLASTGMTEKKM